MCYPEVDDDDSDDEQPDETAVTDPNDENDLQEKLLDSEQVQASPKSLLTPFEQKQVKENMYEPLTGDEDSETLQIKSVVVKNGKKTIIDDFNLTMFKGQIISLLGHNGCGKSTIVNILSKELKPTSGKVRFNGENILKGDLAEITGGMGLCP